jgi:hypothetical protein
MSSGGGSSLPGMTRTIADVSVSLDSLAPIVLGAGTPLFTGGAPRTLVRRSVISTLTATHLTYDVFR